MQRNTKPNYTREDVIRFLAVTISSLIMAVNLKSFVQTGDLFPGGFTGITRLLQRSALEFAGVTLPFAPINLLLNAIPAVISYRLVGKRFTLYSCLSIVMVSIFTDLMPALIITQDRLLICIFGGLINGFAISLCLRVRITSGGTDFIAIALSERKNIDAWNYILCGNVIMLVVAGLLFGWDKALYSIIFQFTSTQTIHLLYQAYNKVTLFIVTDNPKAVYEAICQVTNHSATEFSATGMYSNEGRKMIYSVVSSTEAKVLIRKVMNADPHAFVNVVKTDILMGRFYQKENY